MKLYQNIKEGIFLERTNRFIAKVLIDGMEENCHVKNTGRCRELLIPEKTLVRLEDHGENTTRKTRYSLVMAKKDERWINMDSQAPNKVVYEWIQEGNFVKELELIKTEKTYGNSRFDLYVEGDGKKIFVEVKGVTLEENGLSLFPDAPTLRGIKHIEELIKCKKEGFDAYLIFVIQMKGVDSFSANYKTQPEFGRALEKAGKQGVHILAYDFVVTEDGMKLDKLIYSK